jgi:hypothetical protein
MFNRKRDRNRRLMTLAGIGLGMALLRGKARRRYLMGQMLMGGFGRRGFGPGGWGRFGDYGPGGHADFSQMPLPPFIEARLKAWHDKAHGNVSPSTGQSSEVQQV